KVPDDVHDNEQLEEEDEGQARREGRPEPGKFSGGSSDKSVLTEYRGILPYVFTKSM
ncbi:hypothetical protein A2U01_0107906, partial [Trifolium medium]|nr:hypothetical protein [Trifolium medium]